MQDFREMVNGGVGGGGGARVFAGDRRTRLLPPNQALKCPRCDSINTKFCYYNNYNLSQPRHFCKNCRRYWTKGGVLRNVPVGGGCRKAKRSKTKANSRPNEEMKSTSSHSSSESSSHTATTTTTTTTTNEAASAPSSWSSVPTAATEALLNFRDSSLFPSHNPNLNTDFEPPLLDNLEQTSDGGIFPEIGSFSSLLTASNPTCLGFNFSDISPFRFHHPEPDQKINMSEEMKLPELTAGFMDQTAPDNLAEMQGRNATEDGRRLTELDWPRSGDQGLYNLGSSVDQSYWNQNQCTDTDQPLYIP